MRSRPAGGGIRSPFQHIAAARAETERRLVERRSRIASVEVDEDATSS